MSPMFEGALSLDDHHQLFGVLEDIDGARTLEELAERLREALDRRFGWAGIVVVDRPEYLAATPPAAGGVPSAYFTDLDPNFVEAYLQKWKPHNPFASEVGVATLRRHGMATLGQLHPRLAPPERAFVERYLLPQRIGDMLKVTITPDASRAATVAVPRPEVAGVDKRDLALAARLRLLVTPVFRAHLTPYDAPDDASDHAEPACCAPGAGCDGLEGCVLTARELEVAQLVTEGLANHEIAGRLGITINTVKRHVTHILAKTNSANRTRLAMWLVGR